jgi:predicted amidohydrolase
VNPMNPVVAVAQMNCRLGDVKANLNQIENVARIIDKREADIACFPELVTTGYSLYRRWRELAETIPGRTTERLGKVAEEFGFYLIAGLPESDRHSRRIFNTAVLVNPAGDVIGSYRKVHLWNQERRHFTRGNHFPIFATKFGKIGIGICYDLEFPESARNMAMQGANLIFFPSAEMKPLETLIETYIRSRAAENQVYLGFSNRTGREGKTVFFGRSQITSPTNRVLARTQGSTGIAVATVDMDDLIKYRKNFPYLKQRVPKAYTTP